MIKTFFLSFFAVTTMILGTYLQTEIEKVKEKAKEIEYWKTDVRHLMAELRSERNMVEICERVLAEYEEPQSRQCINAEFDPIEGPGVMVSPEARAAWAAMLKVRSDSTQGAWELVVNADRIYLNGKLMPSVKFAVEQAQPRRWLFVVNCDNANMALSHDLVEALHKARPVTPDSGVIHITHDGEEIPRRSVK
jgi:FtsZ-binding cell division protein ZapB